MNTVTTDAEFSDYLDRLHKRPDVQAIRRRLHRELPDTTEQGLRIAAVLEWQRQQQAAGHRLRVLLPEVV